MTTRTGGRRLNQVLTTSIYLVTFLFALAAAAQEAANSPQTPIEKEATPLEVFQGPQFKNVVMPKYPLSELNDGVEGWVDIGFMVDPQGKPYELTILNASGDNKALHKAALQGVQKWTFEPATLNGEPIDSALSRKIVFTISDKDNGAAEQFVGAYKAFLTATKDKDRAKADKAIKKMVVKNLYEDAYFGLVQFMYAELWGSAEQQLAGLRRAVAGETVAKFLPKDLFAFALQSELALEVKLQDFGSAMYTWRTLKTASVDKDRIAALKPVIDKILILKKDDRAYKVSGQLVDGLWNYILFKKKFRIDVSQGHLSQIKLRCDKKYVFFQFDPTIEYKITDGLGACGLELVGDPDTKFELTQS